MAASIGADGRRLEYGVLGPVRVTRSGTPLALGGPQQRAVLAFLVMEAGSVVSVRRLADALWAERPPAASLTTVQTYVCHLREILEPGRGRGAPGHVLVTESGGYRLQADDGSVDAVMFEQQACSGQAMLASGAYGEAVDQLGRGLSLWRGDVLADLAQFDFVTPFARRLEEIRLTATESKIDAELALGRHASVVAELEELVGRHPLRERLQAQWMLALYRCGRQFDALAAYRRLQRLLDEELGIEPSPPVRQLHQAILAQDDDLTWHPPAVPVVHTKVSAASGARSDAGTTSIRAASHRRHLGRTGWIRVASALTALATVGAVSAVLLSRSSRSSLRWLPANSVGVINLDGSLRDAIPVGQSPDGLAVGAGAVWVSNRSDGTVSRIDAHTHVVVRTIAVGSSPNAITITGEDVWVVNGGDGTVSEVDAASDRVVRAPIRVGNMPTAIASGPSGVWVANTADDTVSRIDPSTGKVSSPIAVGAEPDGIAVGRHTVWVTNRQDGTVSRIDPTTGNAASPIAVGAGPKGIAVRNNAVWVANSDEQSVDRIDPGNGDVVATIHVGDGPNSIVAGPDAIWVTDEYDGTVARIDPANNRNAAMIATGSSPRGLILVGAVPWVANGALSERAHRGGTLTVETGALPGEQGIDPAATHWRPTISAEHMVYDGLVELRQTGGAAGVSLVPDLATTVPLPTDGGRTYAFTLRSGIHYSTGERVRPEDIRRGVERAVALSLRAGYFTAVAGARKCASRPASCDMSRGIITDDATSSVIFHLTTPDPDFLYELTSYAVATPSTAPAHPSATPLPATGPYMIADYRPGHKQFTLVRNPYFHQWAFAAQPAGYPDRIRWQPAPAGGEPVADILSGRADLADLQSIRLPREVLADFARGHPMQLHAAYEMTSVDEFLNTRVPPFNDVRVRRAINYAVDRDQLAALWGGRAQATLSCQVLPPNMPGYQPYCPYTPNPQPNGAYHGPDLTTARRLIASSRTTQTPVTVWGATDARDHALNEYFTGLLRHLGYRASLREVRDDGAYFSLVANSSNHAQIGESQSEADFPAPSTFYLPVLSCNSYLPKSESNNNYSEYCSRHVDELAVQAQTTQSSDPVAAPTLWAQVYRTITNDAPCVPIVNLRNAVLTSPRLGNVQANPVLGPLFDQMWVR